MYSQGDSSAEPHLFAVSDPFDRSAFPRQCKRVELARCELDHGQIGYTQYSLPSLPFFLVWKPFRLVSLGPGIRVGR